MIAVLCCRCHSAEPLARKTMRECHLEGWQTYPIVKGRQECMAALSRFPDDKVGDIKQHLQRTSSWTIFLGTDGTTYEWSDIGKGNKIARLDAELILEKYYE